MGVVRGCCGGRTLNAATAHKTAPLRFSLVFSETDKYVDRFH